MLYFLLQLYALFWLQIFVNVWNSQGADGPDESKNLMIYITGDLQGRVTAWHISSARFKPAKRGDICLCCGDEQKD
ncbi:MAG: hypothetical protein ABSA86_07540 [Oryzomonas sp.]|jgi:hypothetical protein